MEHLKRPAELIRLAAYEASAVAASASVATADTPSDISIVYFNEVQAMEHEEEAGDDARAASLLQ